MPAFETDSLACRQHNSELKLSSHHWTHVCALLCSNTPLGLAVTCASCACNPRQATSPPPAKGASAGAVAEPVPASAVADSALFRLPTSVAAESGEGWYGSELDPVYPVLLKYRPAPPQLLYQPFRWDASLVAALVKRQRELSAWHLQDYALMLPAEPNAYQLFVSQLLPRGLTYEPAALDLHGADGCWRTLDAAYVEVGVVSRSGRARRDSNTNCWPRASHVYPQ